MEVKADMRFSTKDEGKLIRFFPDSPEQIALSVETTGLRDKLHQAVQAAITRTRQQRSCQAAKTGEADSADESPAK